MNSTRELQLPSGSEVEAASLHPPVHPGRFEVIRSRGLAKVHDVRDSANHQVVKMQDAMRANPMKWVAIAAASGFGVGLLGRFAQWRVRTRISPEVIIIQTHH